MPCGWDTPLNKSIECLASLSWVPGPRPGIAPHTGPALMREGWTPGITPGRPIRFVWWISVATFAASAHPGRRTQP
jgi:hypothetical protein